MNLVDPRPSALRLKSGLAPSMPRAWAREASTMYTHTPIRLWRDPLGLRVQHAAFPIGVYYKHNSLAAKSVYVGLASDAWEPFSTKSFHHQERPCNVYLTFHRY